MMLSNLGENSYELLFKLSMVCITVAHSGFLLFSMEATPKEDMPNYSVLSGYLYYPYILFVFSLTLG